MASATICEAHKTVRVTYSSPARNCHRSLRVFPREVRGSQRVLDLQWRCAPTPDTVRRYLDEFGNCVLELKHKVIPREFYFQMQLTTSRINHVCAAETDVPPVGIGAYLTPSALCDFTSELRRIAGQVSQPDAICGWVFEALEYSEGKTNSNTTASQALRKGGGVCQDYAHLMIAVCRAARIPARYVSGYNPAEGRMHAWVEVLQQDQWQAWDPTHNRPTRPDCVVVACGRDARDAQPLSGTYRGRARASLQTWCSTRVLDATEVEALLRVQVESNL